MGGDPGRALLIRADRAEPVLLEILPLVPGRARPGGEHRGDTVRDSGVLAEAEQPIALDRRDEPRPRTVRFEVVEAALLDRRLDPDRRVDGPLACRPGSGWHRAVAELRGQPVDDAGHDPLRLGIPDRKST